MSQSNIYQKIQAVANKVMSINKDMTVGTGSFKYKAVSDLSVTKAVKKAERECGLLSIPTKQELVSQETIKTQDGDKVKITYSFIIKMTVKFVNLDDKDDFIEVEAYGHGLDTGDKGFGKASTYARKYALLNAYKIATGEDPDSEPSRAIKGTLTQSEKRVAVVDYLTKNQNTLQSTLQYLNIGDIADASEAQIESMYINLKNKNKL